MVGKCPFDKGTKVKTPVQTLLVWVKVNMNINGVPLLFDPTRENECLLDDGNPPQEHSVQEVVNESPILKNFGNGKGQYQSLGGDDVLQNSEGKQITTQYGDFFQRANFWTVISKKGGSDYQTVLDVVGEKTYELPVLLLGTETAILNTDKVCQDIWNPYAGYIEFNEWKKQLAKINADLRKNGGVQGDTFVIFLLDSVELCQTVNGDPKNWLPTCIAGYHTAEKVPSGDGFDLYTWAVAGFLITPA